MVSKPAYLPHLDGLRGIAVIMVMFAHFPDQGSSPTYERVWSLLQHARPGYIGVDLFFILSGFLITRILLNERDTSGRISFYNFYLKRTLRIFPIYYLAVAFTALYFPDGSVGLPSLLSYTFNYYHSLHPAPHPLEHTWSLAVEEQFYLLWPFVISVLPSRFGRLVTAVVIPLLALAAAIVFWQALNSNLAAMLIYQSLPTRMLSLSLGAYLAFREREGAVFSRRACTGSILLGLIVLTLDVILRADNVITAEGEYWSFALMGYGAFGLGILAYLTGSASPVARFLALKPLRYVGRISYGLYLYHLIVLYALGLNQAALDGAGVPLQSILQALLLTFAIAILSFHLVEQPLMRMRNRFMFAPILAA